ncbi:MAG: FlgD immunoglobulin-like domain containing protein [Candidatus Krumholzibacteriia bacterium]
MRSLATLVLLTLLGAGVAAAAPGDHQWSRTYNATARSAGDGAGGAVTAATFLNTVDFGSGPVTASNFTFGDVAVVQYAEDGTVLWLTQVSPPSGGVAIYDVTVDAAGAVYVGGILWFGEVDFGGGLLSGDSQCFLVKFDANGDHVWSGLYGEFELRALSVAGSRLAAIGGNFGDVDFGGGVLSPSGWGDVCVGVLDLDGNHVWSAQWGDAELQTALGGGLDGAGNLTLSVSIQGAADFGGGALTASATDMGLVSFDPSGAHRWSQLFSGVFNPFGTIEATCTVGADGRSALTGYLSGPADFGGGPVSAGGAGDVFVASFDAAGQHEWSAAYGGSGDDRGLGVSFDAAGNLAVTGRMSGTVDFGGGPLSEVGGGGDLFLAIYDAAGLHRASRIYGGPMLDASLLVEHAPGGELVVSGYAQAGFDLGGGAFASNQSFVGRLDGLGGDVAVGELPAAAGRLLGAHPNPFNPATSIRFNLPRNMAARLTIHDAAGHHVAVLADGPQAEGEHLVRWNGLDDAGRPQPSGLYLAVLETAGGRAASKLTLLK